MQRKPVPLVKEFPWQWNSTYVWVRLLLVLSIRYPSKCEALSGGHNLLVLPQSLELETKDGNTSDLRSERMKTPNFFGSPSLPKNLGLMVPVWTQRWVPPTSCEEETSLALSRDLGPIPAYMHLESSLNAKWWWRSYAYNLFLIVSRPTP